MNKNIRGFVLQLPGPKSYCNCIDYCSKLEVDHVIPKKILKEQLNGKILKKSLNDKHNLYSCCQKLNRIKGMKIFGKDFILTNSSNGKLARSSLYMHWKYNLKIDIYILNNWDKYNELFPPDKYEYKRSKLIKNYNPVLESCTDRVS